MPTLSATSSVALGIKLLSTLIVLLPGGDLALKSLQAASLAGALPFTFVLLAMVYGLVKSLREDSEQFIENEEHIRRLIEQEVSDLS